MLRSARDDGGGEYFAPFKMTEAVRTPLKTEVEISLTSFISHLGYGIGRGVGNNSETGMPHAQIPHEPDPSSGRSVRAQDLPEHGACPPYRRRQSTLPIP